MHIKARTAVTTALVAVALALAAPAGAQAAHTLRCTFNGVTGSITPGIQLTGGGGTYTFATSNPQTTLCSYDGGTPTPSRFQSSGTFINNVCGTGRWTSSSMSIDLGANGTWDIGSAPYQLDLTQWHGLWKFSSVNGSPEVPNGPKDPTDGQEIDGQLDLVPTGGSCTSGGVTQLTMTGSLALRWNGHTLTCSFTGAAGNFTPGTMLIGGTGSYQIATSDPTTTQCTYDGTGPTNSRITTQGTFTSTICGNGQWIASAMTVDHGADGSNEVSSAAYQIDLAAWHGRWKFFTVNGLGEDPSEGPPDTDGIEIDGQLTVAPTQGDCVSPTGVTGFRADGTFSVKW